MITFPSRCGALALALTVGSLASTSAQTSSPVPEMVHTDAQGRHLAPRDTFYTTEYVSATTDKGVNGFPPGTEVHLVSVNNEAHTLTVNDGHANVDIPPEKLTNDMDIAALVRAKDEAKQAQIVAYQQAATKAYQDYQKEAAEYTAKDLEKRKQEYEEAQKRAATPSVSQAAQPVNSAAYNNGFYNEGGLGYGTPYYYFTNSYVNPARTNSSNSGRTSTNTSGTGAGRGTLPSGQSSTGQIGTTSGGGQAAGGKKP